MRSLVTEIIPERLGGITADFPDNQYQDEAAGVLPTPVIQKFMNSYHYGALRAIQEAGLTINDLTDNITDNQQWDAFVINTKNAIYNALGLSTELAIIKSGKTRTTSSLPDFIRANGSALEFTLLGNTTNLELEINNLPITVDADIIETGITAAPSTNNTADVNDVNAISDKYLGEDGTVITIDNVGSEITSLIGKVAAFKTPTGEILRGYIKSATEISNVFRGFYFDDNGDPIKRAGLSDGNALTLMKIGSVFIKNDGVTIDVTYNIPAESYNTPIAPIAGDYWLDLSIKVWNKYNGATWEDSNSALLGEIVSDSTNTIASRSSDFSKQFNDFNNIELEINSTEIAIAKSSESRISVYGFEVKINNTFINWDITNDLEGALVEAANTIYYLYISSDGQPVISDEKPYLRKDLRGRYHPHQSWRNVGRVLNDASSDFIRLSDLVKFNSKVWLYLGNGHGTTNTYIRRFTSVEQYDGLDIIYTDSSSLGMTLEIEEDGTYAINYYDAPATPTVYFALTKNDSQISTVIQSTSNPSERLSMFGSNDNLTDYAGWIGKLKKKDIIRAHTDGQVINTAFRNIFSMERIG